LERQGRNGRCGTICQEDEEGKEHLLIDTDVLIWYLRGNENAKKILAANIPFKISVISYIELIQGVRGKKEFAVLQKHLKKWSTEIIQISDNISTRAMFYVEDYFLKHSLEFADAVIAATALEKHESILTGNDKHYGFIPNIQLEKFRPK
jgi:predicted nucleic acid-binding protein